MKSRRLITFTFALTLLGSLSVSTALAEQGYYKWTDQFGNPQHSDRPPPAGVEYEFVSTDTGMSRTVTAEESRAAGGNTQASASAPGKNGAGSEEPAMKKNPEYCSQATANLAKLDSAARIRLKDPDGSIRYLSEEEKEEQRQKAKDLMAVHCEDS